MACLLTLASRSPESQATHFQHSAHYYVALQVMLENIFVQFTSVLKVGMLLDSNRMVYRFLKHWESWSTHLLSNGDFFPDA